ncbi:class I SAM-dependent methyltransferase [Leptospira santarosai]|uniref:class I SAM-dependent methyltransferase n=2 Tax=Leptospira santarosai TaxID=28183 RepID=UPI000772ECCC|nr:methyltransferase domain-containing protein [Leptospira santarosai]MDI7225210.1 methyltransferase domain-containing protein [Leptospira santarosai]
MEIPFVDFYNRNNISPVRQDITDLEMHYRRRESLYMSLGLLPGYLSSKKIIEFGPGSGHNAIYTASLNPKLYTLVDGSKVGFKATKERFINQNNIEVVHTLFQDFDSEIKYDIVIAEACLPHQKEPLSLMNHICKFVDKNGIFLITTLSGVSYFTETLRRLIRDRLFSSNEPTEVQLKLLIPIYEPHLKTLVNMSRPVEDWILDNIIQSLEDVKLLSIPDVVNSIDNSFEIIGSSPKFINDWRWYKDIYSKIKGYNTIALDSYYRKNLNFLDYRFIFIEHSKEFGMKLEELCNETWNVMCSIEKNENGGWDRLFENLSNIYDLILKLAPETALALKEIITWMKVGDPNKALVQFPFWWGRGQQYLSFINNR